MHPVPAPRPPFPPSRRRERLLPYLLVMAGGCLAALGWIAWKRHSAQGMVAREDGALLALERVFAAEKTWYAAHGRYAWVDDLAGAGLLDGLPTVVEDGRVSVVASDYLIDVLLPRSRVGQDRVAWTVQGASPGPDPDLVKHHVGVVARPRVPAVSGFRMWYEDEHELLYVNEGVVDDEGAERNPLPKTQVVKSERLDTANWLLWQRLSDVEAGVGD